MKNGWVYLFSFIGAEASTINIGDWSQYSFISKILIVFFIIGMSILCGFGGAIFMAIINSIKEKWMGKKKSPKLFSQLL